MPDKNSSHNEATVNLRHWFETPIGAVYRHAEAALLSNKLSGNFRAEVLQLDFVGWEDEFHQAMRFSHYTILDTQTSGNTKYTRVLAESEYLPIDTHSIDIVIMPHTLEFEENPHRVLREANRVLKPEGIILLTGFNPWSIWHLPRFLPKAKNKLPWNGCFISRYRVVDWLKLLNFQIEESQGCCLFPLLINKKHEQWKKIIGTVAAWLPFLPAAYFVMAVKRVSTGTPLFHLKYLKSRFITPPFAKPATKIIHDNKKRANLH